MKAIEVLVNGKRLCVAGSGPNEFTWASLTLDERGEPVASSIMVAGSRAKTVPMWIGDYRIKEGEEVVLRIVDVSEADPPVSSQPAWTEFPRVKLDD